jgi:hypothetical protein
MASSTSQPHSTSLPSLRQLTTSILSSLFSIPPLSNHSTVKTENLHDTTTQLPGSANANITHFTTTRNVKQETIKSEDDEKPTNPLKTLSPEKRALLMTLHVLIPQPVLLQALDLLDRGLVSKVIWYAEESTVSTRPKPRDVNSTTSHHHEEPERQEGVTTQCFPPIPSSSSPPTRTLYQVRSSSSSTAHTSKSRYKDASAYSSQNKSCIVNLEAWSCGCAAFAFSAFPFSSSTSTSKLWTDIFPPEENEDGEEGDGDREGSEDDGDDDDLDIYHPYKASHTNQPKMTKEDTGRRHTEGSVSKIGEGGWEYGGLSSNGMRSEEGNDNVPICKHLLAVLLGEKWVIMRNCVEIKVMVGESGRDEIAGLAVD